MKRFDIFQSHNCLYNNIDLNFVFDKNDIHVFGETILYNGFHSKINIDGKLFELQICKNGGFLHYSNQKFIFEAREESIPEMKQRGALLPSTFFKINIDNLTFLITQTLGFSCGWDLKVGENSFFKFHDERTWYSNVSAVYCKLKRKQQKIGTLECYFESKYDHLCIVFFVIYYFYFAKLRENYGMK